MYLEYLAMGVKGWMRVALSKMHSLFKPRYRLERADAARYANYYLGEMDPRLLVLRHRDD